jgi:hypothetical protein
MGIYKAEPGSKVLGDSIRITLEALGLYKDTGNQLLAQAGIREVKADEWYDMQTYCDFLGALMEKVGPSTLFVAGRNIGMNAVLPPVFDTPEKVLSGFDQVFKMGHQGVPASQGWKYTPAGERSAIMVSTSPYPDELQRGVCDGFIRRFKTGALLVKIDETKPRVDKGGKSVTFIANW